MHCLIHYNAAEREHYLERKSNSLNVFFSQINVNMNIVFRLFSHKGNVSHLEKLITPGRMGHTSKSVAIVTLGRIGFT